MNGDLKFEGFITDIEEDNIWCELVEIKENGEIGNRLQAQLRKDAIKEEQQKYIAEGQVFDIICKKKEDGNFESELNFKLRFWTKEELYKAAVEAEELKKILGV